MKLSLAVDVLWSMAVKDEGVVHRADLTKKVFHDSGKIAVTLKESSVTARPLFVALIADDSSLICSVLRDAGADLARMRDFVVQSGCDKPDVQAAKVDDPEVDQSD